MWLSQSFMAFARLRTRQSRPQRCVVCTAGLALDSVAQNFKFCGNFFFAVWGFMRKTVALVLRTSKPSQRWLRSIRRCTCTCVCTHISDRKKQSEGKQSWLYVKWTLFTYVLTQYAARLCGLLVEERLKAEFAEEMWSVTTTVARCWWSAAQQQSSVSSLSTSATGGGSSCPPVRWARMSDESVCLIGWEMEEHGKNEATYLLRWLTGGGVSPASSLWERGSCFSWYCWPFSRPLCRPPAPPSSVYPGWHVWLLITRGKGVAGAINMWLHCVWFSTEKAASFNRYEKQPFFFFLGGGGARLN